MDQTFNSLVGRTASQIKKADPWDVIPVKNNKYAKDTTEVHLGNREAQILDNFDAFQNLEILWINNNKLKDLVGIEKNFRIKHLYAHKNDINSIKGVVDKLQHLETLSLYDNELRDLEDILSTLRGLMSLKELDLFSNPVAEEPNYKLRVLAAIPSLELFDRHIVTPEEREKASRFVKGHKQKHWIKYI